MATFPSYVSIRLVGYTETPRSPVIRSVMEVGPPKQTRREYDSVVGRRVVGIIRATSDYQSWRKWVRSGISNGAGWFDWVDPIDDTTKEARLLNGDWSARTVSFDFYEIDMTIESIEYTT